MKHILLAVGFALSAFVIPPVSGGEQETNVVTNTRVSVVACARVVHGPGLTGAALNAPTRDAGGCDFLVEEPSFLSGMRICFVFPLSTPETVLRQFVVGRRASFDVELPLPLSFYQDGSVRADREAGQIIYLSEDPSYLFRWKEAAEPGATDNPDDAQRLREDH